MRNILAVIGGAVLLGSASGVYADIEYLSPTRTLFAEASGWGPPQMNCFDVGAWNQVVDATNPPSDSHMHGRAEMDSVLASDGIWMRGYSFAQDGYMGYTASSYCSTITTFNINTPQQYQFDVAWTGYSAVNFANSVARTQFKLERIWPVEEVVFNSATIVEVAGHFSAAGSLDIGEYRLTLKGSANAGHATGATPCEVAFNAAFLVPAPAGACALAGLGLVRRPRRRFS